MRLTVRLLGTEVLHIDLDHRPAPRRELVDGPPFGFSASPILHTERAWEQVDPNRVEG